MLRLVVDCLGFSSLHSDFFQSDLLLWHFLHMALFLSPLSGLSGPHFSTPPSTAFNPGTIFHQLSPQVSFPLLPPQTSNEFSSSSSFSRNQLQPVPSLSFKLPLSHPALLLQTTSHPIQSFPLFCFLLSHYSHSTRSFFLSRQLLC